MRGFCQVCNIPWLAEHIMPCGLATDDSDSQETKELVEKAKRHYYDVDMSETPKPQEPGEVS